MGEVQDGHVQQARETSVCNTKKLVNTVHNFNLKNNFSFLGSGGESLVPDGASIPTTGGLVKVHAFLYRKPGFFTKAPV